MRIRVLSDLHREIGKVDLREVAAGLVVLAGEIDRGIKGAEWARQAFPDVPVLYVAGKPVVRTPGFAAVVRWSALGRTLAGAATRSTRWRSWLHFF